LKRTNQISGDFGWVLAGINSLAEQCLIKVEKDVGLWVENAEGVLLPDATIINGICLNDCSQHGDCEGGMDGFSWTFRGVA
jgi:hypothetical protein